MVVAAASPTQPIVVTPEPIVHHISKQYTNKKLTNKKPEPLVKAASVEKVAAESQESWNSEDDPNRYDFCVKCSFYKEGLFPNYIIIVHWNSRLYFYS